MGLESFQGREHDILAEESPSHVSTCPDGPLEQNENNELNRTPSSSLLPPLTLDEAAVNDPATSTVHTAYSFHQNRPKTSPQNMPQFRNEFNDRARMGFCYWVIEKKPPKCKGYTFGAYKTSLGLPKV